MSHAMSESIQKLATALIAVQADLPKVAKGKVNPFFHSTYAGLEQVMPAALGAITAHGLGLVQSVGSNGNGGTTLTTILVHESGEWMSDTQPLLLEKDNAQSQGSAITYARRYAVMAMLGLVAEDDDDGNAASTPRKRAPAVRAEPRKAPPPPSTGGDTTNGSPPVPRDELPNKPSSPSQQKFAHTLISNLFGSDELAAYEWVKERCPRACEASPTQVHLTELSIAEASELIRVLQVEQKQRVGV